MSDGNEYQYGDRYGKCCECEKPVIKGHEGYCTGCNEPFCWGSCGGWYGGIHVCNSCLQPPEERTVTANSLAGLPALSIRQPWAWFIVYGQKRIENRHRRSHYRGKFLIHASKFVCSDDDFQDALALAAFASENPREDYKDLPALPDFDQGGIVGVAEIVDCVENSGSAWFVGKFGYVLRNVEPVDFIPCKGRLGFFYPDLSGKEASK